MEFSDYQCAYCREYFINTMPSLEEKYIKAGKIRYYVRDFPLSTIHPQAERMAEASHCAAEVGRYWEARDSLFMNQEGDFENSVLAAISAADRPRFQSCLSEARYAGRVREGVNEGKRLGIDGTHEFLVRYLDDPDHPGELKGVRRLIGAVRADEIAAAIEGVLGAAPQNSAVPGLAVQSAPEYNNSVSERTLEAFVGRPVPTVRAEDLRRVWSFLASEQSESQAQRSVSLNIVAGLCEPKADALAVWFRATLIQALLRRGQLDPWRDGSGLRDKVFEVAAKFPLPKGPAEADLDAFVAAME